VTGGQLEAPAVGVPRDVECSTDKRAFVWFPVPICVCVSLLHTHTHKQSDTKTDMGSHILNRISNISIKSHVFKTDQSIMQIGLYEST